MFRPGPVWDGSEGRQFTLTVSPGTVAVAMSDPARLERTLARARHTSEVYAPPRDVDLDGVVYGPVLDPDDHLPVYDDDDGSEVRSPTARTSITAWSARSRARMTRSLASLDWTPMYGAGRPAVMITLTYPGDWLTVAPDGRTVKRHLRALAKRYTRAWGTAPIFPWKLEFQRRGAPHLHLLLVAPEGTVGGLLFRAWLSQAWADVVGHPDPSEYARHLAAGTGVDYLRGGRCFDPKRAAVYFAKHGGAAGGKEYQHVVPEAWQQPGKGPGRFWGVQGLEPATATVTLEVREYVQLRRTLRRLSEARGMTRQQRVQRVDTATGALTWRTVTRRRRYVGHGALAGGFLLVNDGPAVASALARWMNSTLNREDTP